MNQETLQPYLLEVRSSNKRPKVKVEVQRQQRKINETIAQLQELYNQLNSVLELPEERPIVRCPADAYEILKYFMGNLDHEELWVLILNTQYALIRIVKQYQGTLNQSTVRVAEVFKQAIIENANSILVAHNHPSGHLMPSQEDVNLTNALVSAGKLLDITVIDHLIIGLNGYKSLKESGVMF